MAIIDKIAGTVTSLLPRRQERHAREEVPPVGANVLALRDDLDRWLERFFEEPWGLPAAAGASWVPTADVHETDRELVVSVEVPGMDPDNLEVAIAPHALVVRGEAHEAAEDTRKDFRVLERRYGRFERVVPLPGNVDVDHAEARIDRGVLTVRFPKTSGSSGTRRIPISTT